MKSASEQKEQNIIFMGNFSFPKGMAASKRIKHYCDYFVEAGSPVKILMLRQGRMKRSEIVVKGVYDGIPFNTIGEDLKPNWKMIYYLPLYFLQGMWCLITYKKPKTQNYLYVYNGYSLENVWFAVFAKLLGYRLIIDIVEDHSLQDEFFSIKSKILNLSMVWMDKIRMRLADGIIVISHVLWNTFEPKNIKDKPMVLIPICAHPRPKKENGHYNSPIRITYAGSFAKKDGIDHLINAFLDVRKDRPGSTMALIGMGKSLPKYIEQYGTQAGVEFPGCFFGEDYYEYLENSDILCVPRINIPFAHAGFPYKLGEYLATGKPVVISDTGDVRRYLKDKEDAMIVEPGNQEELSDALAYLLDHPNQAFKIGEQGLNVCKTQFSPRKNYEKLRGLMNTIA